MLHKQVISEEVLSYYRRQIILIFYLPSDPDTLRGHWLQNHLHGRTIRLCRERERGTQAF